MIQVYSDGSCIGNPGPGAAAWRILQEGNVVAEGAQADPSTTNNRMELLAAILALEDILRLHGEGVVGADSIEMRLDSQYTLGCMFDWLPGWKAKGFAKVKNVDLVQRLDDVAQRVKVAGFTLLKHWVKGHAEDIHNNAVDVLAQNAARSQIVETVVDVVEPPVVATPEVAPQPAPVSAHVDGIATLAIADMLLTFARDQSTTPEMLLARIRALKTPLGL